MFLLKVAMAEGIATSDVGQYGTAKSRTGESRVETPPTSWGVSFSSSDPGKKS